jgi:hypothetical protein
MSALSGNFAGSYNSPYAVPVNNAGLDPLSGYDADVWTLDQATGLPNLLGRFRNMMLTVRNSSEPYLELNQRIARILDGEIQIAFVLDRGMISTDWLERTFGFSYMTREALIGRNPRFQITLNYDAPELVNVAPPAQGTISTGLQPTSNGAVAPTTSGANITRQAKGKYVLTNCKIDSFTHAVQAGRPVLDCRWEGIAEGIIYYANPDYTGAQTYLGAVQYTDAQQATMTQGFRSALTGQTALGG